MSTLTIRLPDEDVTFLRAWSENHGISAEEFLAGQVRNLREHMQRPLHPEVVAATGIFPPDLDVKKAYHEYIEKKYL